MFTFWHFTALHFHCFLCKHGLDESLSFENCGAQVKRSSAFNTCISRPCIFGLIPLSASRVLKCILCEWPLSYGIPFIQLLFFESFGIPLGTINMNTFLHSNEQHFHYFFNVNMCYMDAWQLGSCLLQQDFSGFFSMITFVTLVGGGKWPSLWVRFIQERNNGPFHRLIQLSTLKI